MKRLWFGAAAVALFAIAAVLLYGLRGAWPSLALAFFLSYLCQPLVTWLERHQVRRQISVPALALLGITTLTALLLLTLPPLLHQIRELLQQLPDTLLAAWNRLEALAAAHGLPWPADREQVRDLLRRHLGQLNSRDLADPLGELLGGAWKNLTGALLWLLNLLVIPIFFFFLTLDYQKIRDGFFAALPRRLEPAVRDYAARLDAILAGYLRGQLAVCACLAALYSAGLLLSGVPFALPIGLTAGFLSLIPYLGFGSGLLLSAAFTLVDYQGPGQWLGIALTFALAQGLEGNLLTPRLVGKRLGLSALESILAAIAAAKLIGFWGVLLAIPSAAFLKVLLGDLFRWYRQSEEYQRPPRGQEP